MHSELRNELAPEEEVKEEYREGTGLGQTVELEIDVSNLLKIYYSELPSGKPSGAAKKTFKKWSKK